MDLVALVLEACAGRILLRRPREPDEPVSQCLDCQHYQGDMTCTEFLQLPSLSWRNVITCPERAPRTS